jgi:Ca2+/Na+ antiporter
LYDVIVDRAEREEDLGKAIDAKITALLAGIVAFMGFSFRLQLKGWNTGSALVYLVPLAFLLSAFMTKRGALAPSVDAFETFFPQYPVSTVKKAVGAVASACRTNQRINERKASRLEIATLLTAGATAVVLVVQFAISLR